MSVIDSGDGNRKPYSGRRDEAIRQIDVMRKMKAAKVFERNRPVLRYWIFDRKRPEKTTQSQEFAAVTSTYYDFGKCGRMNPRKSRNQQIVHIFQHSFVFVRRINHN